MKFCLQTISKTGRLGLISDVERLPGASFETPLMLFATRGGTISHLTMETLDMLFNTDVFALLLPHACNLRAIKATSESKMSISEFAGMKESLSFCTVNDPLYNLPGGFNIKSSVAVWTNSGKSMIEPKSYMDAMEALKPDFYQTLCDSETDAQSSKKRLQRSVKSTGEFFEYCMERHKNSKILGKSCILASLVGGYCTESRVRLAKEMALQPVDGFLIEGLDVSLDRGETANIDAIIPLINETVKILPEEKMRVLPGCWSPEALWALVQSGIDVFDSSLPTIAAERGSALTFKFDSKTKDFRYLKSGSDNAKKYEMNLADIVHKEALEPIMQDCDCVTCKSHTRAYIHHLLTVKELLGPVLLMMHNLYQYIKFFKEMREAVQTGNKIK